MSICIKVVNYPGKIAEIIAIILPFGSIAVLFIDFLERDK